MTKIVKRIHRLAPEAIEDIVAHGHYVLSAVLVSESLGDGKGFNLVIEETTLSSLHRPDLRRGEVILAERVFDGYAEARAWYDSLWASDDPVLPDEIMRLAILRNLGDDCTSLEQD